MFLKIFVIVGIVVAASTFKQGDDDSLSKERKELTEERKEITEIFRRETERLRQEDEQLRGKLEELHGKLEKVHKRDEKHQKQMVKMRKENQKRIAEMEKENQKQVAVLRKENQKLRRADSKIKKVIRQRDQNITLELRKLIGEEIHHFLKNEKICVGGTLGVKFNYFPGASNKEVSVHFGRTFPRQPTVLAALSYVYRPTSGESLYSEINVVSVTNSTAVLRMYNYADTHCKVSWMACL